MHASSFLACFSAAAALCAQGTVAAPAPCPDLGAAVINRDAAGTAVQNVQQIELRHLAGGSYRAVVTAQLVGHPDTSLISGTLDLTTAPPTWTPDNHVDLLNVANAGTDEFQGSMSLDGLVIVWDNYVSASYPNATGRAFVCRRPAANVPFQPVDVRTITGITRGLANYFDPHIGGELPNGHVLLFFIDSGNNISKGELDPATGSVANAQLAVQGSARTGFRWAHSPSVQRDSTGAPRALSFAEYTAVAGAPSDGWWTEGIANDGTPQIILPAIGLPAVPWYNNPAVTGGTWVFATYVGGTYVDPTRYEGVAVANTDLSGGSGRIVAFAPIRPRGNGTFFSAVAIGTPAPPYTVPPVAGDILVFPTLGVTDVRTHDPFTGLAEWAFQNLGPGFGGPYTIQVVSLDSGTSQVFAGNTATLVLP